MNIDCSQVYFCSAHKADEREIYNSITEGCFVADEVRVYLTEVTGEFIETLNHELMHLILYEFVGIEACEWYDTVAKIVDQYHRGDNYVPTVAGIEDGIIWAIKRYARQGKPIDINAVELGRKIAKTLGISEDVIFKVLIHIVLSEFTQHALNGDM